LNVGCMKNGYQHMVHDFYVDKLRKSSSERDQELQNIHTEREARRYQERVLETIGRAFSPVPEKTPLNAEVVGVIERPNHRIERVLFESRPECLVTGNLYLPESLDGEAPGVVAPCGHSSNGKAAELYQAFCQRLARSGFVVLIYDPFNQGERDQYHGIENRDLVGSSTYAHNMMGKQMELMGEFFGMWRAWDGVRALDYLLSRPEVDSTRVGVTGNSGGGTLSEWLWAVDERFTMAAPSCFITTFLNNLENELPQDAEQYPPGLLGEGLEMIDLMIARAPKPAILLGQNYDYFDRRGLEKAYGDLKRFYDLLGAPENVDLFIGPHGHGYFEENQRAMVRFFAKQAGLPFVDMGDTEKLDDEALLVTETGNTIAAGSRPVYAYLAEMSRKRRESRAKLVSKSLVKEAMAVLGLKGERPLPRYRVLRPITSGDSRFGRYALETEDGVRAILRREVEADERVARLEAQQRVSLYIPNISSEQDIENGECGFVGDPLYALDVRGMGESMPEGGNEGYFHPYGLDYMYHGFGIMMGQSYLGRRVYDVLSTMDLLGERGAEAIDLYGRGQGSIIALFAGLVHDLTDHVTLKNCPGSFEEWAQVPVVGWPAANFPRGILNRFDIPDMLGCMEGRVKLIEPWGPDMKPLSGTGEEGI